ncbi:MAG TPA: membrane protein insertion efficiency factor YidD [Candidatus Limnocylindria bacterium]
MKALVLAALRFYKGSLSPLLPPACRYTPTCSEYAIEAVERFGALRGSLMAIRRLLACNPFSRGGYDPVPQRGGR